MPPALTGYLSVRGLPKRIESRLVAESRRRRLPKSQVVIEALERHLAAPARRPARPDPAAFFARGRMTAADLAALDVSLAGQRAIEPTLWR
jgi:hypothetical protein